MSLKSTYLRTRYGMRNAISHLPSIYFPLFTYKLRRVEGPHLVTATTDLVIEGFPRSGNTFAVNAFRLAQNADVSVAHHTHAAAQLIRAVRLGRPALLIVRDPKDAVLSFVIRQPEISIGQALRAWIFFHKKLLPRSSGMVVATFDQITTDFSSVVERVNKRFGTSFERFNHDKENVEKCFEMIDSGNARRFGGGVVQESRVSRPSASRVLLRDQLEEKWQAPDLGASIRRAYDLYQRFEKLC